MHQSAQRLAWATADGEALEQQDADEVAQVRLAGREPDFRSKRDHCSAAFPSGARDLRIAR
jgi:hypothetical protein